MQAIKRAVATLLAEATGGSPDAIVAALEYPPDPAMGDLAFPCFGLAKTRGEKPAMVSREIVSRLGIAPPVLAFSATGPYVNVQLDPDAVAPAVLGRIAAEGDAYGHDSAGAGATVVVDYSSPNIGKPIAFHHLRSTMIGNALVRILRARGHRVVGVNHLGDWGTQFGYLVTALCGRPAADIAKLTVTDLHALYVEQNAKAKGDPAVANAARAAFAALERGEPEPRAVWEACVAISRREFDRMYARLGVAFEATTGESFYEPRLAPLLADLATRGIATVSDGALIVDLAADGIDTPCLLRKSDGATLYATRDIAAALFRQATYHFTRCLYVTDQGQGLHFKQWFAVVRRMGHPWAAGLVHVPFGVLLVWDEAAGEWTKGKTRSGKVVLLEEVLDEAVRRAAKIIAEKNPALEARDRVAEQVGMGAVIFNDLKNRREKEVRFRYAEALNFDGDAGPYVQNAHVRACGIFRHAGRGPDAAAPPLGLATPEERGVLAQLARFPEAVAAAAAESEPCRIAQALLDVAGAFHRFYHHHRVIDAPPALAAARLRLVDGVRQVLKNGLGLLGIGAPEEM